MTSLPQQLQDIADMIGLAGALKLADIKGGQRITIPARIKQDHWLVELLGMENAKALANELTHNGYLTRISIEMPRGPTSSSARRNSEIFARLDAGENPNQIAQTFGVSRRWVLELKSRRSNGKSVQQLPDLFGDLIDQQ